MDSFYEIMNNLVFGACARSWCNSFNHYVGMRRYETVLANMCCNTSRSSSCSIAANRVECTSMWQNRFTSILLRVFLVLFHWFLNSYKWHKLRNESLDEKCVFLCNSRTKGRGPPGKQACLFNLQTRLIHSVFRLILSHLGMLSSRF